MGEILVYPDAMDTNSNYVSQIYDLIEANGWKNQLIVEVLADDGVKILLSEAHPLAPLALVNEYWEQASSFEQIQQECLRALRTGRPGI